MSILGIAHTAIAIVALLFAAAALVKEGIINPFSSSGKIYSILTVIASVTSFGLSKEGGFNPGHGIGILILILLGVAYLLGRKAAGKKVLLVIQVFCMTLTLFLSLIPAINETLLRVPVGHPLSDGPTSPIVQNCIKVLLVVLIVGLVLQFLKVKKLAK
jgi:small-conductance mechanosensitive channel